jgi:predicted hotdog family 3-hydroxylacyl-ACP dehydratase
MSSAELPAVSEVLPHSGNMVLLTRILAHDFAETICEAELGSESLLGDADGGIGAWVGLELMAQCVAAHAGLVGRAAGTQPRVGFLLGSRRVRFHRPRFLPGQTLKVSARHEWGAETGLVAFECAIEDAQSGECLAAGRLNCFLPEKVDPEKVKLLEGMR